MPDERAGTLCVFCRRQQVDAEWRPFCSERCKLQDLARWAGGNYRIPGEQADRQNQNLEPGTEKDGEGDSDDTI